MYVYMYECMRLCVCAMKTAQLAHLGYKLFLTAFWPYFLQRYPSSRISSALLVWKANLGRVAFFILDPFLLFSLHPWSCWSRPPPFSGLRWLVLSIILWSVDWAERRLTQSISGRTWGSRVAGCIDEDGIEGVNK